MVDHPLAIRPPLVIPRTDSNFVQGLFEDLKTSEGRQALRQSAEDAKAKGLRLLLPIHRASNILLVDVACDGYGFPRLDPTKIESAGLVVRRVAMDEKNRPLEPERLEGWLQQGKKIKGWATFAHSTDLDYDPDPKHRRAPFASGNVEINRRLILLAERHFELAEQITPAFATPPDVCEAAGRTLVFGVIPVATLEVSEMEPAPQYSEAEMLEGFPTLLQQGSAKNLTAAALETFLRQLAFELGAFGSEPQENNLLAALNMLRMADGSGAGATMRGLYTSTFENNIPLASGITWPSISASAAATLKSAVFAVKQMRLTKVMPPASRFDSDQAFYRARMFLRVKNHPECPSHLYWSDYSDRFRIAPWYEPAGPPVKIPLPDVSRSNVKNLKPNVAFQLPPGLFDMLSKNSPKDFLDGKGKEGSGVGLGWICSFSLPIITLCAFIVLNIFLQLLNIVFWWMFYIKICIPIPVPRPKDA